MGSCHLTEVPRPYSESNLAWQPLFADLAWCKALAAWAVSTTPLAEPA